MGLLHPLLVLTCTLKSIVTSVQHGLFDQLESTERIFPFVACYALVFRVFEGIFLGTIIP